jgi:hypothetical protein
LGLRSQEEEVRQSAIRRGGELGPHSSEAIHQ